MKKGELIDNVAEKCCIKNEVAELVIEAVFDEIAEAMVKREEVAIHGFGKFITRPYGERNCYNPITSEMIMLKPSVVPVFKPGPKLRNKVNK